MALAGFALAAAVTASAVGWIIAQNPEEDAQDLPQIRDTDPLLILDAPTATPTEEPSLR